MLRAVKNFFVNNQNRQIQKPVRDTSDRTFKRKDAETTMVSAKKQNEHAKKTAKNKLALLTLPQDGFQSSGRPAPTRQPPSIPRDAGQKAVKPAKVDPLALLEAELDIKASELKRPIDKVEEYNFPDNLQPWAKGNGDTSESLRRDLDKELISLGGNARQLSEGPRPPRKADKPEPAIGKRGRVKPTNVGPQRQSPNLDRKLPPPPVPQRPAIMQKSSQPVGVDQPAQTTTRANPSTSKVRALRALFENP